MAIVDISVVPVGTPTASLSGYVARAVEIVKQEKDIKYELTAMGTIIEGDFDRLMALVSQIHRSVLDAGVDRVVTVVKIDERRDKESTISGKIESVRNKLAP